MSIATLLFLARISRTHFSLPWILGVLAFIGAMVWLSAYLEKKRAEAMQRVAEELRLQFLGRAGLKPAAIAQFHVGSQGHSREMRNVMTGGTGETEVTIFDYTYVIGHGKGSSTHSQTIVRFQSEGWTAPAFDLRPEGLLSKLGSVFGGQDIDFATHPVFSKMFVLKGADETAIRTFFDAPLLTALESKKGISVENREDKLLFFRASKKARPEAVRALLEEAYGVYAHFADAAKRRA